MHFGEENEVITQKIDFFRFLKSRKNVFFQAVFFLTILFFSCKLSNATFYPFLF